jgi:hypothetical protein
MKSKKKNYKRRLLAYEDYSNISTCRTKILVIFRGLFVFFFFAVFQNSYVFIPLFLSEPLTVFCETQYFRGTHFEKHCSSVNISIVHGTISKKHPIIVIYRWIIFTCRDSNLVLPDLKLAAALCDMGEWRLRSGFRIILYLKYWYILYKERSCVTAEVLQNTRRLVLYFKCEISQCSSQSRRGERFEHATRTPYCIVECNCCSL